MKVVLLVAIFAIAGLTACSTTSNNANMKGANTNTAYVTNSDTNAKPTMSSNVTNVSPPAITNSNMSTSNSSSATGNTNANRANANRSNVNRP